MLAALLGGFEPMAGPVFAQYRREGHVMRCTAIALLALTFVGCREDVIAPEPPSAPVETAAVVATGYSISIIEDLAHCAAAHVNNKGEIAGWCASDSGVSSAHFWSERTGRIDFLPGRAPFGSFGRDINNRGQVVGQMTDESGKRRAYVWSRKDGLTILGPTAATPAWASAINDAGQVVGAHDTRAFLWTRQDGFIYMDPGTQAIDVNNRGEVLARTSVLGDVIWTPRRGIEVIDLGPGTEAARLSNRGELVGHSTLSGPRTSFVWRDRRGLTDLGSLGIPYQRSYEAFNLNNRGWVVGFSESYQSGDPAPEFIPWIWTPQRGMRRLPTDAAMYGGQALDISNSGLIVGRIGEGSQGQSVMWKRRGRSKP